MIYRKEYFPQFRESDHTGLVGAGGYFEYFQDAVTAYMHTLGKGNDTLPEDYGICWVFTKYKLHIEKRTGYDSPWSWPPGWKIPALQFGSTRPSPSPVGRRSWPRGGWRAACAT